LIWERRAARTEGIIALRGGGGIIQVKNKEMTECLNYKLIDLWTGLRRKIIINYSKILRFK